MDTLIHDYENFKFLEGETIIDIKMRYTRSINWIISTWKGLHSKWEKSKDFKRLVSELKVKVIMIKKCSLNDYPIDTLFGSLGAYKKVNTPDKIVSKMDDKQKSIALKDILIDKDEK